MGFESMELSTIASSGVRELVAVLRKAGRLSNIGYQIGVADMRGHDLTGERLGKVQDEIESEIFVALQKWGNF